MQSIFAVVFGVVVCAGTALVVTAQQAPSPLPPGISRARLVENDTVVITRLVMAPGEKEDMHTHPFSAVVIQIGAGEVNMRLGRSQTTTRREHGFVQFIPREMPHAALNVGAAPFEVVTVAIKQDRRRGGEGPAPAAPDGVTRTPVLDNAEARVTRVVFAPGARKAAHTHPFDLVVVQLTPGRVEIRLGDDVTVKDYAAGEVLFLPRGVPHAASNVDRRSLEVLSVAIK